LDIFYKSTNTCSFLGYCNFIFVNIYFTIPKLVLDVANLALAAAIFAVIAATAEAETGTAELAAANAFLKPNIYSL
jgi:dihydrodipicolinate reductase